MEGVGAVVAAKISSAEAIAVRMVLAGAVMHGIHGTGRHLNFGKSAKIIHLMRLQKRFPLRGLRCLAVQKRNSGLSLLAENLYCSKTEL